MPQVQACWENQACVYRSDEKKKVTSSLPRHLTEPAAEVSVGLVNESEPTPFSIEGRRSHLSFPATTKSVRAGAQHKSKPHLHLP